MHDCIECKFYYKEYDNNYDDCLMEMEEEYWEGKKMCPKFESRDSDNYDPKFESRDSDNYDL